VRAVAITPDGKRLVTGSDDNTARLWDLAKGFCLRTYEGHTMGVRAMAISPDGRRLVTMGSWDQTARLWDLETGRPLQRYTGHTGWVSAVAITPDGKRLVTGSGDRTARLWDLGTGRCLQRYEGHTGSVTAVAISPDGKRLVTGSWDQTARLWDLETGRPLQRYEGHTNWVTAVAITPDGKRLVTGSDDHSVRFWDLETGQHLVTLHHVREGCLWTTPPTEFAPSGWFWAGSQKEERLISVVERNKKDDRDPVALAEDNPERGKYLSVYRNQRMVMGWLCRSTEEMEAIEGGLVREKAARMYKQAQERPQQLGQGVPGEGGRAGQS
jgi:WD40 repeat protein